MALMLGCRKIASLLVFALAAASAGGALAAATAGGALAAATAGGALAAASAGGAMAAAGAGEMLPLDEVRPGMEGTGRTVFEGSRVDEFGVRILGVLDNALGPRHSLILARLEGGPLGETGVIAGMSGSPVFVDGKLVGAVSYAFTPFGKEPIAGITPIADMLDATRIDTPRARSARFEAVSDIHALSVPLDRDELIALFARPRAGIVPGPVSGLARPQALSGGTLAPLALPLVFSGFDPATFEWARDIFSSMGFVPVLGSGAAGAAGLGPLPDVEPGAAVGVSLIEGDYSLSATGTITHIDEDRVYAFGHPFANLGPTRFPMKKAYVYSVFPSLQSSWKIAAALDPIGTVEQDRSTAIAGRLGTPPSMVESRVRLTSTHGGDRTFEFRIVQDEFLTPLLAYLPMLEVLRNHERAFGTSSLTVTARLLLEGGRAVELRDVFASAQPAQQAAGYLAALVSLLVANDFEDVAMESVDIQVVAEEENRNAEIVRAWVDETRPLRPGTGGTLKVLLQPHRGGFVTHAIPFSIPQSAPAGVYDLLVADAATFDAVERQERQQVFAPRNLNQLLQALNDLRSNDVIYARLSRPGRGVIVGDEYLPGLPGSVLSVLRAPDQGARVVPLRTTPVWKGELPTEHALSGARRLRIEVER